MAITSLSDYYSAARQQALLTKMAAVTVVSGGFCSVFDVAGQPGAGVLAGTSTANGVVPTDATAGCPPIGAFSGGKGYFNSVTFANSVTSRIMLFDMLFKAGQYAYTGGTTTLSAQPSYSGRVPGGTDYVGTQIWLETTVNFATGTAWSLQVTYTAEGGATGHTTITTGSLAAAALVKNRMYQLALQAGDTGVQKIESVIVTNSATAMTAGNFNILVLRPLWDGSVMSAGLGDTHGPEKTGMMEVYTDSAIVMVVQPVAGSTGIPYSKSIILDK